MSSETLSQQEIDLLFSGTAAPAPAPARSAQKEVLVYDFRRPNRISKDRMRALEAMYGVLAKSLEGWLAGRVRTQIDLRLLGVEQYSFGEFVLSLSSPCAAYVFDIEGSGGQQGVVDFGRDLGFYLVERMLGGTGAMTAAFDRALSPLERMVVRIVAERAAHELATAWQDQLELDLELSRFESIPDMLQITNREDPVLVANLEASAPGLRGLLILCLPFGVLESFFTGTATQRVQAARGTQQERLAERAGTESALRSTAVPISVNLPGFRLSLGELHSLRPGSVLATGLPVDAEAELLVSGQARYRGRVGRAGRRLAVRIDAAISPDANPDTPEL